MLFSICTLNPCLHALEIFHPHDTSAVFRYAYTGQLPDSIRAHANLCMLCTACFFFMFKQWFCLKFQYNKYMFNFIDIYSFIPVSGFVGMSRSALIFPGAYNAAKMALFTQSMKLQSLSLKQRMLGKSVALVSGTLLISVKNLFIWYRLFHILLW